MEEMCFINILALRFVFQIPIDRIGSQTLITHDPCMAHKKGFQNHTCNVTTKEDKGH